MTPKRLPRFRLRSANAGRLLDVFLVCAVAAVLGNRMFLVITGYPQLGNSTLHISHAIWGAVMMAIAIIAAISYLPPFTRSFAAFLGGAGFGWFIDEIGKFITRDVDYFFQPAIAIIYLTFVAMYLVFRTIGQRPLDADEATLNAIEALKDASLGRLSEPDRRAAIARLDDARASGGLTERVRALLVDVATIPAPAPTVVARIGAALRAWYQSFVETRAFVLVVDTLLILFAVAKLSAVVGLALDGPGVQGFSEWAGLVSSLVSGLLVLVGAFELHRSRLRAYQWFDRGLLVDILVTQVFVFQDEQLGGIVGLGASIAVWVMVRSAAKAERERTGEGAAVAVSAAPAPQAVP